MENETVGDSLEEGLCEVNGLPLLEVADESECNGLRGAAREEDRDVYFFIGDKNSVEGDEGNGG